MNLVNRIKGWAGMEHRADGYTNAAIDALIGMALGTGAQPSLTGAVATATQAISAPFGTCRVSGAPVPLRASFLVDLVRRLMLSGNSVYLIGVDLIGGITLTPAASFKVGGSSRRPIYELEVANPGGETTRRRATADGVIHVMVNASITSPWMGRAPWALAKLTAEGLAVIENSLKLDSSIPAGMLLPVPDGIGDQAKTGIRNALARGKGMITPVETTAGGFGQSRLAAPKNDYLQMRFGPLIPESSISMRDSTSLAILRSYGVSPKVLDGDGNAMREGRARFFGGKVRSMRRSQRQAMIDRDHDQLSLVRQCTLLDVSRAWVYYRPAPPRAEDLELMALMDRQYLKTPSTAPGGCESG